MRSVNQERVKKRRQEIIRDAIRARNIPLNQHIISGINFILSARAIGEKRDHFKASIEVKNNE
ncbi:MAG: hypothetical protein INQ03_24740 [Candidatus Heimdallarchaeota archaeon]|nr:hypothetical protein [Candidatus Heimdallarchaeota archaeon]